MAGWYRANYRPDLFNPDHPLRLPPVRLPVRYLQGEDDAAFVPGAARGSGGFVGAGGCWVDTGSRDEAPVEAGCSHFLEHLLFKGSERLTAQDIARAFDSVGARSNAFTSQEYTCFWAQLRDHDLPMGMELLAEMLLRPAFRPEDIASEANVVLEEINMNEDDPGDVAHDQFARALWGEHCLALPGLGTRESIGGMPREAILSYWGRRSQPAATVLAAAGHVEHERGLELAEG